ncbi:MAG: hypothetical protein ACTTKC_08505 [Treponema sp.]|uniref:hypothetical protein n=1 Tax=Treponema sp. TaxID=166 RepID=UPI003FA20D3F
MPFPPSSGLVPPGPGAPVPYTCTVCGHNFTHKKPLIPLPVKCPKCGSGKCISAARW